MVLNTALMEDVIIRKKDAAPDNGKSPFDVEIFCTSVQSAGE
jgi:hypothetical protein